MALETVIIEGFHAFLRPVLDGMLLLALLTKHFSTIRRIPCGHRLIAVLVNKVHKGVTHVGHGPFVQWDVQEVEFTSRTSFLSKSQQSLRWGLTCLVWVSPAKPKSSSSAIRSRWEYLFGILRILGHCGQLNLKAKVRKQVIEAKTAKKSTSGS